MARSVLSDVGRPSDDKSVIDCLLASRPLRIASRRRMVRKFCHSGRGIDDSSASRGYDRCSAGQEAFMLVRRTRVLSTLAAVIALAGFLAVGLSPRLQADDGSMPSRLPLPKTSLDRARAVAGPVEPTRTGGRPRPRISCRRIKNPTDRFSRRRRTAGRDEPVHHGLLVARTSARQRTRMERSSSGRLITSWACRSRRAAASWSTAFGAGQPSTATASRESCWPKSTA